MKSKAGLVVLVATLAALGAMPTAARGGDIFVTSGNAIGEYTTSGATVNDAMITRLDGPQGLAESGGNLFVANNNNGTVGEYTTLGATVNASLITGLNGPQGIIVSGGNLFVTNYPAGFGNGTIA
jgi:DNA-binding beta-propeller fold protein YncE